MMRSLTAKNKKTFTYAALALFVGGGLGLLAVAFGSDTPSNAKLATGETIQSWQWAGPYADGGALEKQANDEIKKLKRDLGKGTYPDYQLLVGIAGQYELLGDGTHAYEYLQKAIAEEPRKGLAYVNLGHLLDSLGAPQTAREAYDKAIALEPTIRAYADARTAFMKRRFPNAQ